MPQIARNVRSLSAAAWRLRAKAPTAPFALPPFALTLMTDDRRQEDVLASLDAVPSASAIPPLALIFRHDGLPQTARRALAKTAMALIHEKGHLFLMARGTLEGADGCHAYRADGIISWPMHDARQGITAAHQADIGLLSPIFPTPSHQDARTLGPARAAALAQVLPFPCFALGGITSSTAKRLHGLPFYGIGAIGAWSG